MRILPTEKKPKIFTLGHGPHFALGRLGFEQLREHQLRGLEGRCALFGCVFHAMADTIPR